MTNTDTPHASRDPLPHSARAALGGAAAALLVFLFSALHADPDIRVLPIVALVAAAGAAGGALFPLTDPLRRRGARRVANALRVFVFFIVIKIVFVAARHGPF